MNPAFHPWIMVIFHMTGIRHHGIQAKGTRCGTAFNEGHCGGSDRWWGKVTVFFNFVGLIVHCSSVSHHWCLTWLYDKCFSHSSIECLHQVRAKGFVYKHLHAHTLLVVYIFTINSVWVKLTNNSNGALLAKTQGSSTLFYGLEVSTESANVILQLLYLPSTMTLCAHSDNIKPTYLLFGIVV